MHERYARQWLEHQAIAGMLTFDKRESARDAAGLLPATGLRERPG